MGVGRPPPATGLGVATVQYRAPPKPLIINSTASTSGIFRPMTDSVANLNAWPSRSFVPLTIGISSVSP